MRVLAAYTLLMLVSCAIWAVLLWAFLREVLK